MKIKKRLFPYVLGLALLLTAIGLVSANISFSKPPQVNNTVFSVSINNIEANNIEVIGNDNTNISYIINLNDLLNDYTISFDVVNESSFDVVLFNKQIDELPEELKNLVTTEITIGNKISENNIDRVTVKYTLKNKLTNEEKTILNKYSNYKVNIVLNYNQE